MKKQFAWVVALVSLLMSNTALALRCGRELVTIGDYKAEVYDKCGQPESIETHREFASQSNNARIRTRNFNSGIRQQYTQEIRVEEWIYNFGSRRLMQFLRFENGRLVYIETLGRGN